MTMEKCEEPAPDLWGQVYAPLSDPFSKTLVTEGMFHLMANTAKGRGWHTVNLGWGPSGGGFVKCPELLLQLTQHTYPQAFVKHMNGGEGWETHLKEGVPNRLLAKVNSTCS